MIDKKKLANPKLWMLVLMALNVLWALFGPFRGSSFYTSVSVLLFVAMFGVVCWHLVRSVVGAGKFVATIGKPGQAKVFGFPKWKVYLIGVAVFIPVFFLFLQIVTRKMVVYQMAMADARGSAPLRQALGDGWKEGLNLESSYESGGGEGHAEVRVPVKGPLGSGNLEARGVESHGQWTITELVYVPKDGSAWVRIAH